MSYRFGRFELEPELRRLLLDGEPIKLSSRAFDILSTLVERHARVVTKEELMHLVWHGVVVEDGNLHVHVVALRKLLGRDAIATVPGHGYRFTLPLEEHHATAPNGVDRHVWAEPHPLSADDVFMLHGDLVTKIAGMVLAEIRKTINAARREKVTRKGLIPP